MPSYGNVLPPVSVGFGDSAAVIASTDVIFPAPFKSAGVDSNLLGRTLGIPAELLNVRANASRPSGFFSTLGSSLGGALGGVPGLFL